MPTAPWTEAPTSWPASGLSSSQTSGVEAVPTAPSTTTEIFRPCVMTASAPRL
ncbi:hypothetical protein [Streptomyces sp. NPDC002172]